jgi:hypothetical protein|nr:MAG TPA_asm: hypothetical protein [Caudoviricetes sp.]
MDALYVKTPSGLQKVEIEGTGGSSTQTVQTDKSRDAVLTAGTAYTVPTHKVGKGVLVYLGGVVYTDFTDVSATTISFDVDIPATMEIVVVAEA